MVTIHSVNAMNDRVPERVAAANAAILVTLRNEPVQYPALIAGRSGLHIPTAERGCRALSPETLLIGGLGDTVRGHEHIESREYVLIYDIYNSEDAVIL